MVGQHGFGADRSKHMDPRIEIWRVLHDGQITALAGEGGGAITMFVSIPYLRRRLVPLGDSLVLRLGGVRRFQWCDNSDQEGSLQEEIECCTTEILGTESESMPVTIDTTMGRLIAEFESVSVSLDTGEPLSYEHLRRVCMDYWTEFERRAAALSGNKKA
jgi:hypothetical protein